MKALFKGIFLVSLFFLAIGCASRKPVLPVHDEVLIYDMPYDLTYLKVLNALQSQPGWDLDSTVKESGLISVRNGNFSALNDADKRIVNVVVARIGVGKTSVSLDSQSQQTLGAGDLLKAINKELSAA